MQIQCLPDLTNRLGPGQLFIKPGNSLNPKFLWNEKIFEVKKWFIKPGLFVKTEFVKSGRRCIIRIIVVGGPTFQFWPPLKNPTKANKNANAKAKQSYKAKAFLLFVFLSQKAVEWMNNSGRWRYLLQSAPKRLEHYSSLVIQSESFRPTLNFIQRFSEVPETEILDFRE